MFGRKAVLSSSGINGANEIIENDKEIAGMQDARRKRSKGKHYFSTAETGGIRHHQPEVFAIGAVVLKKDFTRIKPKGGKLDAKWTSLYKVAKSLGRELYHLEDVSDLSKIISRVNVIHLKPRYLF